MPYNQPQNPGLLTRLNNLQTGYAYSVVAALQAPREPSAYVLLERDHPHDRYVVLRADLRDCTVHGGRYVSSLPRAFQIFGEYAARATAWAQEYESHGLLQPLTGAQWDRQAESYGGPRRVLNPVVGAPADGPHGCVLTPLGRPNTVLAASVAACGTWGMVLVGFSGEPTVMCKQPYRLYTLGVERGIPLDSRDYEHDVDAWSAFSLCSVSRMEQVA